MKPYYEDPAGVTIFHGDCREILPAIELWGGLVVTDPPYVGLVGGYDRAPTGGVGKRGASVAIGDPWGASLSWVDLIPSQTLGAIVFCTHHSLPEVASAFADYRRVALLTWWKRNAPPTGANVPRFRSEFAWAFARGVGIKWDALDDTVFEIPALAGGCMRTAERVDHPTQKPLSLMTRVMHGLCPTVVLDPFAGSGTTLRAAKDLGIPAIGIEIEERYCEIAAERLSQTVLPLGAA